MNRYLLNQYRETRAKFTKYSARLENSQERGEFQKLSRGKQNFLITRIKKLWEKLRILEAQLKITTVGASLAFILMVSNLNAQEQFVARPDLNPIPPPSIIGGDPVLADIDNDGDLDLLLHQGYYGDVAWYKNTGTPEAPVFEKVPDEENPLNNITGGYFWLGDLIDPADIDNDGDIDLFGYNGLLRNTGNNETIEYTFENHYGYMPYPASLGDIDNDGDLDLVNVNNDTLIYIYKNTGSPEEFILASERDTLPILNFNGAFDDTDRVHLADLDGDGDLDLLLGVDQYGYGPYYYFRETMRYVRNTGTPENAEFTLVDEENDPYSVLSTDEVTLGDLDNDGDHDVILFSYYGGSGLQYFELNENLLSENMELVPQFYDGLFIMSYIPPQFVDFDGDGDKDMFVWGYEGYISGMILYEQIETEKQLKFRKAENQDLPYENPDIDIQFPFFVDLDLDGDNDIVMLEYDYSSDRSTYKYLENTGTDNAPVYTREDFEALAEIDEVAFLSFIDLDKDGDLDMFAMSEFEISYDNWEVITLYFESTGTDPLEFTGKSGEENPLEFLKGVNYEELFAYQILNFSDLDEDGDTDVILSGYYDIMFIEDTGIGEAPYFEDMTAKGPFKNLNVGYLPRPIFIDLDDDGDDDMLLFEYYNGTVYYENLGGPGEGYNGNLGKPAGISNERIYPESGIYPNPAGDVIHVLLEMEGIDKASYEILSVEGKIMKKGTIEGVNTAGDVSIGTAELQEGFYFLRVQGGDQINITEFLKQ